jgi:hypothetical protein
MARDRRHRWYARFGRRSSPFLRFRNLDWWMPADYPMGPPTSIGRQREVVRQLAAGLSPGAVDEGTGEVLHNLVNAWADQELALVDADHQGRQAAADSLVGAAAEVVAQREPRYLADQAEVARTQRALANGHHDPAYVAGRPPTEWLHVAALALAAGADLAAFRQVVALVMRADSDWLIWLLVAGFTAAALTLAHFAGRFWRAVKAGEAGASRLNVRLSLGLWLVLGAAAFTIRLLIGYDSTASDPFQVDQTQIGESTSTALVSASALLFLALYLAAGAVAFFGAYLTHDPLLAGHLRVRRAHRRAVRRLARSASRHERARLVLESHLAGRRRDQAARQAARAERFAVADELKRYAEVLIASQLQDPAATDGIGRPDRRPWAPDEKEEEGEQTR